MNASGQHFCVTPVCPLPRQKLEEGIRVPRTGVKMDLNQDPLQKQLLLLTTEQPSLKKTNKQTRALNTSSVGGHHWHHQGLAYLWVSVSAWASPQHVEGKQQVRKCFSLEHQEEHKMGARICYGEPMSSALTEDPRFLLAKCSPSRSAYI